MIGAAVFAGAFAVLFLVVAMLDPRKLWWRFRAPRLDNPEAHEPSSASFGVRRLLLVCVALYLGWQAVSMLRLAGVFETGPDHAEVLDRVEYAALNLETDKGEGRYKMPGLEGSWDMFINPRLKGPERDDPVATLVEDPWAPEGNSGSAPETDPSKRDRPQVERYNVAGICLTVTATPLPGQSDMDYAIDNLRYSVETEVVDSPCG